MGCCSERFTMQSASRNNSTLSLAGLRHEKLLRLNVSTSSPETWNIGAVKTWVLFGTARVPRSE